MAGILESASPRAAPCQQRCECGADAQAARSKWSIDSGSCMRGKIASPFYVTAVNTAGSSNTDKCGQCIEVRAQSPPPLCLSLALSCSACAGDVR